MKYLIGKTIKELWAPDDGDYIIFITDSGDKLMYVAEGDCCSSSYFYDINGINNLLNAQVIDVILKESAHRDTNNEDAEDNYYVIQYCCYEIKTLNGCMDIEFRNHSNGYYSGWAQLWTQPYDISDAKRITTNEWKAK